MKKIIFQFFFFIFFLVPSLIYCQYSFSTDYIELCNWKENVQKWSNDCEEAPADGLFVVNEAETLYIIFDFNNSKIKLLDLQGESKRWMMAIFNVKSTF
jgi:hypothetical protein